MTQSNIILPSGKKLYPFQKQAVGKMLNFLTATNGNVKGCYNACEMGLGKTPQTIVALNTLRCTRVLVICPAIMRDTWAREFKDWSSIKRHTAIIYRSQDLTTKALEAELLIISYDLAAKKTIAEKLAVQHYEALILDEAHYLKSYRTVRTKTVLSILWPVIPYKIALSGTPFTQSVVDGWSLFSRFAPDSFSDWWNFVNTYAYIKQTPWGRKIYGLRNHEQLSKIIRSRFFIRYKKEEVLKELPPKQYTKISLPEIYSIKLSPSERLAVERDAKELVSKMEQGIFPTVLPPSLASQKRLQGEAKVSAVLEFIQDLLDQNIPTVVFGWYKSVLAKIQTAFAFHAPAFIDGDTPPAKREEAVKSFQEGHTNLFIGNMAAAGTGITLTKSHTVVLAELEWSPSIIAQAIDRLHRIGQKDCVDVYYFVVENSIDEHIINVVMDKVRNFSKVLENKSA